MKGQTILIENPEAIDRGETLGIKVEPIYRSYEFYFDLTAIHAAYINPDGDIAAAFPDGCWVIKHDEEIWGVMKEYLEFAR